MRRNGPPTHDYHVSLIVKLLVGIHELESWWLCKNLDNGDIDNVEGVTKQSAPVYYNRMVPFEDAER